MWFHILIFFLKSLLSQIVFAFVVNLVIIQVLYILNKIIVCVWYWRVVISSIRKNYKNIGGLNKFLQLISVKKKIVDLHIRNERKRLWFQKYSVLS